MVTKHKIMNYHQLIYYATLAPSGHNTQPWKFSAEENTLRIYPDFQRSLPVVDADNHALYISLGNPDEQPVLLIRMGYAAEVPRSPRRSLDEVLINGADE